MIEGLGERLKEARLQAAVRLKRTVSQAVMAQLVTEELLALGEAKTVSQPMWSEYEAGKTEPTLTVIRAAANVSGLSEVYITYAQQPMPPFEPRTPEQVEAERRRERAG